MPTPTPVIVLVHPQLGENIGKAARAMLNFGLTEMRLVSPRDGWPNPDAGPAAAGADVVLDGAQGFENGYGEGFQDGMAAGQDGGFDGGDGGDFGGGDWGGGGDFGGGDFGGFEF